MIDVGDALVGFGDVSPIPKTQQGYPKKNDFYSMGLQAYERAVRYAAPLAKTDPKAASDLVILAMDACGAASPWPKAMQENYRAKIRLYLGTGNVQGAQAHAKKITDATARKAQLMKIENKRKALGV